MKTALAVKAPHTPPKKPNKSLEETLWDTANKLGGSMSINTKIEDEIGKKLVENDLVDCMNAVLGQLFYTTQIPACLWLLIKKG